MRENLLAAIGWFVIVGGAMYLVNHFECHNAFTEPWERVW